MRWERRTIALAHNGCRAITAEAEVFGDWAMLKTPDVLRDIFVWGWQVCHVPTGCYLVADFYAKRDVRPLVRRIAELTDWSAFAVPTDAPVEIRRRVYDLIGEAKRSHSDRIMAYHGYQPPRAAGARGGGGVWDEDRDGPDCTSTARRRVVAGAHRLLARRDLAEQA